MMGILFVLCKCKWHKTFTFKVCCVSREVLQFTNNQATQIYIKWRSICVYIILQYTWNCVLLGYVLINTHKIYIKRSKTKNIKTATPRDKVVLFRDEEGLFRSENLTYRTISRSKSGILSNTVRSLAEKRVKQRIFLIIA